MKRFLCALALCALTLSTAFASVYNDDLAYTDSLKAPTATVWQEEQASAIASATAPKELEKVLADRATIDALLASVGEAYAGDPIKLTQIAAISQYVMRPGCDKAPAQRKVWTDALLQAAQQATAGYGEGFFRGVWRTIGLVSTPDNGYTAVFLLDQLRWCGRKEQIPAVDELADCAVCPDVASMAKIVSASLKRLP